MTWPVNKTDRTKNKSLHINSSLKTISPRSDISVISVMICASRTNGNREDAREESRNAYRVAVTLFFSPSFFSYRLMLNSGRKLIRESRVWIIPCSLAGIGFLIGEHWPENSHFALARTGANLQALLSPVPLAAKQRERGTDGKGPHSKNEKLIAPFRLGERVREREGKAKRENYSRGNRARYLYNTPRVISH